MPRRRSSPRPGAVSGLAEYPLRPGRVRRAHPPGEERRRDSGHRVAQRQIGRSWFRFAEIIEQAGADGLELNCTRWSPISSVPRRRRKQIEDMVSRTASASAHPGGGEAVAILHRIRERGASARRGGRRRPRPLQSLLSARHRHPHMQAVAAPGAVDERGAAAAAAVAGDSPWSRPAVARGDRRRRGAERRHQGLLAGADAVQIVSALLRHGPALHADAGAGTRAMDGMERARTRLDEMRGQASLEHTSDPPRSSARTTYGPFTAGPK